jgi:hypothetical protein
MNLIINFKATQKIKAYVQAVDGEVSGVAKGSYNTEQDAFIITDAMIFKQDCGSAHTSLDSAGQAQFFTELIKRGENTDEWCVWWHSHAEMAVFFSKTDTDTIEQHSHHDFLVSLVVNKNGEAQARLDCWKKITRPKEILLHYDLDLPVIFSQYVDEKIVKSCQQEVSKLVTVNRALGFQTGNYVKDEKYNYDEINGYDDVDTEEVMEWLITSGSGRRFNQAGYDRAGFDVYGFNEQNEYRENLDAFSQYYNTFMLGTRNKLQKKLNVGI